MFWCFIVFPRQLALGITAEAGATSLSGQPVDLLKFPALEHPQPLLRLTSATSTPFDWLRFAGRRLIDKEIHAIIVSYRCQGLQNRVGGGLHQKL